MSESPIYFYNTTDYPYGCFSNFSRHSIFLKGKKWPTSEHYFQAQKFVDTSYEELVRNARDPGEAARLGRDRSKPLRKDWENIKNEVMKEVVMAKFIQHKDLLQILLGSGDKVLIEHTSRDSYWGDGGDGTGSNWLGKTLIIVRDEIRTNPSSNVNTTETKIPQNEEEKIEKTVRFETTEQTPKTDKTEEVGQNEESPEEDDEDEDNEEENGQQLPAQKSSDIRIISAPPQSKSLKKLTDKRRKARRKRNVFLDSDGSATIEKSEEHGGVNVVGTSTPVSFTEKALPASAKLVVNRNQYVKKRQAKEKDFQDDIEEEAVAVPSRRNMNLSDFLPATMVKPQPTGQFDDAEEDYLFSASQCVEASKNTLELLNQLKAKNNQEIIDTENDQEILEKRCHKLKELITEFINQPQQEDVMMELLQQFENLSQFSQ